ncbi:hypothetical protein C1645_813141 [Glomus cerebriforme]|uniref:Uncharacterized protein n=1 Tax=Glomus cerebriforme TaxID=658196 RepID=A0A397TJD5_9GLOM|nr:hypothetical protein C1645_813141 [Glomus cerebriforme]
MNDNEQKKLSNVEQQEVEELSDVEQQEEAIDKSENNIEHLPIFKSIDISNNSIINKLKFSSKEFSDFMKLLTKWNLFDACDNDILKFSQKICHDDVVLPTSTKQECQLVDQINVAYISFKKVPIMTYKEVIYYLYY